MSFWPALLCVCTGVLCVACACSMVDDRSILKILGELVAFNQALLEHYWGHCENENYMH